ncbi:hypothetical protein GCK32_022360, partial [Trichostrongylus colubriformis]
MSFFRYSMNVHAEDGDAISNLTNLTSSFWFMRDVLRDGHHPLHSMCHFIAFNVCVGFFGYYIWLMFPRPVPNDTIQRRQH